MEGKKKRTLFIKDERAVSEEFTTLPALTVVIVGFTFFLLLLANTIIAYEERINILHQYQTAEFLSIKLTNPDCYFIRSGGLIDLTILRTDNESLKTLQQTYQRSGMMFFLRLRWENTFEDFPEPYPSILGNRIAVTKDVGILLNDARTIPGKLTIILWSVHP